MKAYTTILEEIKTNNQRIKELEAKADELLKKPELAAVQEISARINIKKSITEDAEAAAAKAYAEIDNIKAVNTILSENVKASFAASVEHIIKEIMQKYAGKQYGEKTREKIREAAQARGIMFYFDGYSSQNSINVYCLSPEGYKAYNMPEINIHATDEAGHAAAFISESNKIQDINNIIFYSRYKYTENPAEKIAELNAAYNAYKTLIDQAAAAESLLNSMLPDKIDHFNVVGHLSPWKKPY